MSTLLTNQEVQENTAISGDLVSVENFVGRICENYNITTAKYKWWGEVFEVKFALRLRFTNYHNRLHPLRVRWRWNGYVDAKACLCCLYLHCTLGLQNATIDFIHFVWGLCATLKCKIVSLLSQIEWRIESVDYKKTVPKQRRRLKKARYSFTWRKIRKVLVWTGMI